MLRFGGRRGLFAALTVACVSASAAHAQVVQPDSAEIYERMAFAAEYEALDDSAVVRAMKFARLALASYARRGDERGQARSLVRIANAHSGQDKFDSAIVNARRAISLLRRLNTDSVELADVLGTLSNSLLRTGAPVDSSSKYRAESIQLFRLLPDRRLQAGSLSSHGYAFYSRAARDTVFRKDPANLDSALYYFHVGNAAYSLVGDSLRIGWAFGNIANVWHMRGRVDSALTYRRRGIALSTRYADTTQMLFDLSQIALAFSTATHDRLVGSTYNLDSALVWYRKAYEVAKRADRPVQITNALYMARMHNMKGQQDSAQFYLQRALTTAREKAIVGAERTAVRALSEWFTQLGYADSTIALHREVERSFRASKIQRTPAVRRTMLDAWDELGHAHESRQNGDSALFWFRQVLDSVGSDSTLTAYRARMLTDLGNHFLALQQPDSAMWYFRELSSLATRPNLRTWIATAQQGIGRVYLRRGDVDSGLVQFTQLVRASTGLTRANALSQLAGVELSIGRVDSALAHRRMAVDVYSSAAGQLAPQARELQGLGEVYRELGLMDSALVHYRSALDISKSDGQRDAMNTALQSMAVAFSYADNADSSFVYFRRALQIANGMDSPIGRAYAFNAIGKNYLYVGHRDSARTYVERSYALYRANKSVGGEATTLANLGFIRLQTVADDSTFTLLRHALALQVNAQSKSGEAEPRLLLARAFVLTGHPDSALVYARRAVELARTVRNRQTEGRALSEVGRSFAAQGRIDSARVYYSQAVAVMRAAGFARGVRVALAEMAELFRTAPGAVNLSRATAYYDSAAAVVDNARRGAGGEENELAFGEAQVDVFGGWARAWVGRSGEVGAPRSAASALAALERGRAQSLVDMLTRLQSANRATALAQYRPTTGSDLAIETDSLLSPLRTKHVAALTYLIAGDTLFTWLLTPSGTLELQTPVAITDAELNRLVRSSRRSFAGDETRSARLDPDELALSSDSTTVRGNADDDWKRLASLLLPADLGTKVPAGTPIVIVPHGSIGLVPFAALTTKGDTSARAKSKSSSRVAAARDSVVTLGSRNPLRFAPSFAALRASESRSVVAVTPALRTAAARNAWRATRSTAATPTAAAVPATTVATAALVVGNPSMPYVYSGRWTNRAKLQPLPGAEAEARTIATQLGAQVLTGKAATETAVRARMSNAPLIHFATHGLAYGAASAARRSFVAFAPDSAQDGLLTMGELMDDPSLTLHAELVVLSACQTGLGNMKKAEGSVGLQRALLAKGARSVLVSLWNVDDKATRLLMEKFYAYWLDPATVRSKATALQMAQDAVRRTPGYANPKYWAAFQLVGAE